jgi:hypothetical protein
VVLASLSAWYPTLRGRSPTRYSPVRHSADCSAAFDLHVLGTPPAFILSQDQTLRKNFTSLRMLFPFLPNSPSFLRFPSSCHSSVVKVLPCSHPGGSPGTYLTTGDKKPMLSALSSVSTGLRVRQRLRQFPCAIYWLLRIALVRYPFLLTSFNCISA